MVRQILCTIRALTRRVEFFILDSSIRVKVEGGKSDDSFSSDDHGHRETSWSVFCTKHLVAATDMKLAEGSSRGVLPP